LRHHEDAEGTVRGRITMTKHDQVRTFNKNLRDFNTHIEDLIGICRIVRDDEELRDGFRTVGDETMQDLKSNMMALFSALSALEHPEHAAEEWRNNLLSFEQAMGTLAEHNDELAGTLKWTAGLGLLHVALLDLIDSLVRRSSIYISSLRRLRQAIVAAAERDREP
jgi:hypothetical protein